MQSEVLMLLYQRMWREALYVAELPRVQARPRDAPSLSSIPDYTLCCACGTLEQPFGCFS